MNGHLPLTLIRGTRQGDPISPTLFTLRVECLNSVLLSELRMGLAFSSCHRIKVQMYADDIVLCTASRQELGLTLSLVRVCHVF
jgi:hypothetical protein